IAVFTSRFWQEAENRGGSLVPKLCLGTQVPETPFRETEFPAEPFPNRVWERGGRPVHVDRMLRRLSVALVLLVYGQLVRGCLVRHTAASWWPRLHLLAAFVVAGAIVWLLREMWARPGLARREIVAGWLLGAILLAQLALGIESWLVRFPAVNAFGQ